MRKVRGLQQERLPQWEARSLQRRVALPQERKPVGSNEDPAQPKIKK